MKTIIKKSAQKKVTDIVTSQKKPRPANEPTLAEQIANLEDIKAIEDKIGNFDSATTTVYHIGTGTVTDNLVILDNKIGTASDGNYFRDSATVADNLQLLDAIIGPSQSGSYIVGNNIFEDLASLDGNLASLNDNLASLSSTVDSHDSMISDLQGSFETLSNDFIALQESVGTWDESAMTYAHGNNIVEGIYSLDTEMSSLNGYISELFGQTETLDSRVSALAGDVEGLTSDLAVSVTSAAGSGNVATVYTISQGSNTVGTINIPKDFLVKSATLQTVATAGTPYTGAKVGDKYIDFVVNTREGTDTAEHIYLPVNDLVDVYTAQQNATQVQLSIGSDNVISAVLVDSGVTTAKIADSAVTTSKIADGAVTTDKIAIADTVRSDTNWTIAVSDGRLVLRQLA